jgi:hypothetical protein
MQSNEKPAKGNGKETGGVNRTGIEARAGGKVVNIAKVAKVFPIPLGILGINSHFSPDRKGPRTSGTAGSPAPAAPAPRFVSLHRPNP